MKPPATRCTAFRALPWLAKINALGLSAAVAFFAALLWPLWLHDDNLTHGIFLPVLAGILVIESRRDPSPRFARPGPAAASIGAPLAVAGLACYVLAIIYAAALGWSHSLAEFMLAAGLVLVLGAAWLGFADQRVRFIPLNWPAAVAVALWIFAAPPPPGTYARLAFFMQTLVTDGVVRVLGTFGIAAYQNGNVIELARTSVGVSEACSGVRSLISCTVAGLFLSAALVRRPLNRALVIILSPAIGLAMNFLRSLLLTLLANAGVDIEVHWHDVTGGSILVGTTLLVAALGFWLRRREAAPAAAPGDGPLDAPGRSLLQVVLAGALALAGGLTCLMVIGGPGLRPRAHQAPDLAALFPEAPPGWTVQSTPNLDDFSGTLQTHDLMEKVYSAGPRLESEHLTLYVAYWKPGQAPVTLVDAHTPDACWPGTGWEPEPVPIAQEVLGIDGRRLAPAECRRFSLNRFETHVWFWHLYGGQPLAYVDPYSALRLVKQALRYGFGQPQDQLFVRVSSNRPWQEIATQPTLRQFFSNVKPLGL